MAPAALRFLPPHRLPPQPKARFFPYASPCRECWPTGRRQFFCSTDPHHERPANDDAQLRAEISPSVLRALEPQDASPSPNTTGESLIERNLRKRAMSQQASSSSASMEERSSASVSGNGELSDFSSLPETQGSPDSTSSRQASSLSDNSSFPAFGGGNSFSWGAVSSPSPITAAFWQESPPGFDMEEFHNIDFYAWYFRVCLLSSIAFFEDPAYLSGLSAPSIFWLLLPTNGVPSSFLDKGEDMFQGSKQDIAGKLGRIMDNKSALSGAIDIFSGFWSSKAWIERTTSGKASELVITLAYSAYVYILSGAADGATSMKKKLEECSVLLNQSLTQLHGPLLDPIQVWEKALKGTSFALDGSAFVYDHALIFPCKLKSTESRVQFGPMLEEVQSCLDKEFKGSDSVVLLHRSSDSQEEFFIVVAPWYWVLTVDSKQVSPIPEFLCVLSCLATSQFAGAGLDFGFSWEQYVVPLGWAVIIASAYLTNNRRFPTLCPFPSLGAVGKFSSDYGVVSSRSSLISALLKSSCAPLAVSLLLLVCGFTFWGPSHYNLASVVDFRGYVLVPPDLFSYSGVLTKLLQSASVATIQDEDGGAKLAASPVVLAGLLGLNFTAFRLFPGVRTDGGYLLRSLLKSKNLANQLNLAFTVLLTCILCAHNPFLGLGWIAVAYVSEADCFVKDDVSDADLFPSVAAAVLVIGTLACFTPLPL